MRVKFWDGTSLGPVEGDTLQVCSPDAVRWMLRSPSELSLARAFVVGDLALEGDIFEKLTGPGRGSQDYRDVARLGLRQHRSVGMFEHLGSSKSAGCFGAIRRLLRPDGRLLNRAILERGRIAYRLEIPRRAVCLPDGELVDVGKVVLTMEEAGFEVRYVECLREHYVKKLRAWVANLEQHWESAVAEVGVRRARVWQPYMAASANGFEVSVTRCSASSSDRTGGPACRLRGGLGAEARSAGMLARAGVSCEGSGAGVRR